MAGPSTCARCLGPLRSAVLCPQCEAPHCAGCAGLPAVCARAGCTGRFPPGPLPPLGALARGAAGWTGTPATDGAVLVLLPGTRAARAQVEGALAVGELLGAGLEAGQRRLASGLPEPLLRAEAGVAEGGSARLATVGLPACVIPAAEVAAPLLAHEVQSLVPGDVWRLKDAQGTTHAMALTAPRLVISADLIEVRTSEDDEAEGRPLAEAIGIVCRETPGPPLLVRARAMRGLPGLTAAAPLTRRLGQVLGQLAGPPARGVALEGTRAPSLLAPRGPHTRANLLALLLAARLLEGAWRAGRLPEHLPAIERIPW